MATPREFEGKDLNEAIDAAARVLGIDSDAVHFEIVDEGRRGILGLGARQVRIRVEVPEPRPPARPASEKPPAPARPASRPTRGRSRERERERGSAPAAKAASRRAPRPKPEQTKPEEPEGERPPWLAEMEKTLSRMFGLMEFELKVRAVSGANGVRVELSGPDRRAMLAKDGELLSELNFLVNRMSRRAWPEAGRIRIECDGFRNRREDEIVELTREVARQVSRTGKAKRLHPMNPYERRLVHMTVQEFPTLFSRSEGDGFLKRVRLGPRGESPRT